MGGQIDPLAGKSPHWVGLIGEWWSRDRYLITGLIVAIAFRGGKWRYGKFTQASRNFSYWIQKPISNLNKMIWKIGYWIIKFKNQYPITKFLYQMLHWMHRRWCGFAECALATILSWKLVVTWPDFPGTAVPVISAKPGDDFRLSCEGHAILRQ